MCYVAATTDGVLRVTVCAVDSSGAWHTRVATLSRTCIDLALCPAGSIGAAVVTPERAWVQWEVLSDCVAGANPS